VEPPRAEALEGAIRQFQPQVICFTSVSSQYSFISELARGLKRAGLISSSWREELTSPSTRKRRWQARLTPFAWRRRVPDFRISRGACSRAGSPGHSQPVVENTGWRRGAQFNPRVLSEVDELPFPDRRMWEPWIPTSGRARHAILVSRGCPYSCSYCSNHALRRLASGRYVRFRSPGNVIAELAHLKREYPEARDVYLQTETIGADPDWVHEFRQFSERLQPDIARAAAVRVQLTRRFGLPE
jgi:hypothetical protein